MKKISLFLFFFFLFSNPSHAVSDKVYKEISTFSKILEIVEQNYVQPVDGEKLMQGAITGMLSSLDPHTVYLPPEHYRNFSSDTRGRFGGIGIEVSVRDGVLTVIAPIEDTPAWEAGIKSGDKILAIDGKSTKDMSLSEAVQLMRGNIGKKVALTVWREGHHKSRTISIARRLIKITGVKTENLDDGILFIRILSFQEGVSKTFKNAIQDFINKNELKGLILDLRDNPGGLLSESIRVSDVFLEKGVIVSTKGRNQPVEVEKAHRAGTIADVPVVVLINSGSASASEIVAGALQDNGRAKLMGIRSFGKGSVQTLVNLNNGGAVKITIAHYFTPKDRLIDGKGIDPDIILDLDTYKKEKKLDEDEKLEKITREEFYEFQKQKALEHLRKQIK